MQIKDRYVNNLINKQSHFWSKWILVLI